MQRLMSGRRVIAWLAVEAKAEICEIEAAVRKEGECLASCRG